MLTPSTEEITVRSHDVLVASGSSRAAEFDAITTIGAAARLAVNLRGVPPVEWRLLKDVAVHRLGLQPAEVRPAVELLAEAEMVDLDKEGRTIKAVLPDIPYFSNLYDRIGTVGTEAGPFNEHEQIAVALMERLGRGPVTRDELGQLGAEKVALDRVLQIGAAAGFALRKRARGRDVYISPGYFAEDPQAFADLAVAVNSTKLGRVLQLVKDNQGYPLRLIQEQQELAGYQLDAAELKLIAALAGEGFIPPPAIRTAHAGENHFIFGPQPGVARLAPWEVQIHRNALALAAAVRQGQLLSKKYAIKFPDLLLQRLKERGVLGSNSEAMAQYRVVAQHGVGRLVAVGSGQARFELIRNPDNERALDMAIALLSGGEGRPGPDEELVLAMRRGEEYVEPLLARRSLADCRLVEADAESKNAIDTLLLGGRR